MIRNLIKEDPRLSIQALSDQTDISWSTIERILTIDLGKQSVCSQWTPHELNNSQKQTRIYCIKDILKKITKNLIFIDEKWVYLQPFPSSQNSRYWLGDSRNKSQQSRRNIYHKKSMIIVGINYNADYYFEILEEKETITSERYKAFLKQLLRNIDQRKYVIIRDNARPHQSLITTDFLKSKKVQLISQPPYSPDTNMLDRFIFRNFENARRKITFNDDDEILDFLEDFLDSMDPLIFKNEYHKYLSDLKQIINHHGNYLP